MRLVEGLALIIGGALVMILVIVGAIEVARRKRAGCRYDFVDFNVRAFLALACAAFSIYCMVKGYTMIGK